MTMRSLFLGLLLVTGCGGGQSPAMSVTSGLDGTWMWEVSAECSAGMTFAGLQYSQQFLCFIGATSLGDDIERGDVTMVDSRLRFMPRQASCSASDHRPWSTGYAIKGDSLSLNDASSITTFQRFKGGPDTSGGGTGTQIKTGCWTMGNFTPSPLADL